MVQGYTMFIIQAVADLLYFQVLVHDFRLGGEFHPRKNLSHSNQSRSFDTPEETKLEAQVRAAGYIQDESSSGPPLISRHIGE